MQPEIEQSFPLAFCGSQSVRLPKTWPHVIRSGDVAVKIYKNTGRVRGENFRTFVLSCYANGKRQLRRFMDFGKASEAAARIAEQKAQGALGAAALSATDRVSLQQALALLVKTEGVGHARAARLVEIVRLCHSPCAAAAGRHPSRNREFYKQKHPANMPRKSVAEGTVRASGKRGPSPPRRFRVSVAARVICHGV